MAGREDAYFIFENNWLGVADGVSQWSFEGTFKVSKTLTCSCFLSTVCVCLVHLSGISEGLYAQELMRNCQKIISDETAEIYDDPVQVLHRSVNETKSSGSSTALIAHLTNNVRLLLNRQSF